MSIRIVIVEDEALIADHLAVCLEDEGYEVQGIYASAEEALEERGKIEADLYLVDINLAGDLDGVDLAHQLNQGKAVPFIFLTSNTEPRTITRVKHTHPAGFIVKPFQARDLRPTIELATFKARPSQSVDTGERPSFMIKDKQELRRVYYDEIDYVEAADNYSYLFVGKTRHVLSHTLKTVAEKLKPHGFFRSHRSYLINLKKVDSLRPGKVQLAGLELPVSNTARQELLTYFDTF